MSRQILAWAVSLILAAAPVHVQGNPGAIEDAAMERRRILKAADQLDLLTQQVESLRAEVGDLRGSLARLDTENRQLRESMNALRAQQQKERETLLAEVGRIVTESSPATASSSSATPSEGYEHVVTKGQSLWAIANAFQQQGVKVSVEDIRKANNLDANAVLKVGQKLFIPSQ